MVCEIENTDPNKRSSSSSDSTNKLRNKQNSVNTSLKTVRYLWIRIALLEKELVSIVDHLQQNSSKYYEKEALVADPVSGQILASLLVGPCALDYSKMKTQDHFWTDPPADELVQRHRLSSPLLNGPSTPPVGRKPLGLTYKRSGTGGDITGRPSNSSEEVIAQKASLPWSPRDYVESLHQNCKSTLLYGKNNVVVQPREDVEPMPGYLSLHQTPGGLAIKWTPNQLMNGCTSVCEPSEGTSPAPDKDKKADKEKVSEKDKDKDKSPSPPPPLPPPPPAPVKHRKSKHRAKCRSPRAPAHKPSEIYYWDYALSVNLDDIVYLHCHQQDTGGTVVLVGQDGVQRSPIRLPKGGHLLAFLSCLENGLAPYGQLDPPLWSQKGKGKVFPRLRRKGRGSVKNKENMEQEVAVFEDEETTDYVFRIIAILDRPDTITQEMFDPKTKSTGGSYLWRPNSGVKSRTLSSTSSTSSKSVHEDASEFGSPPKDEANLSAGKSIQILCDTMKRQIISRAFYGWLAHCRHLRTVRTHLAGLVNSTIIEQEAPTDATTGLTRELWEGLHDATGKITDPEQLYRLIYFGGCEPSIRKHVWPYLLGHHEFESSTEDRTKHDLEVQQHYEITMTEWLAVEAIVRQRDKEIMAANLAKLSSESTTSSEIPLTGSKQANNLSNDVFTDSESEPESDGEKQSEGRKNGTVKTQDKAKKLGIVTNLRRQKQLESQGSQGNQSIIVTNSSVDMRSTFVDPGEGGMENKVVEEDGHDAVKEEIRANNDSDGQLCAESRSACVSPASSNGGVYSAELLDQFSLNLHRIDKDVQRCDRNFWYFISKDNLEKLRNVMCTYVWEHLDQGYVQGMCDLVAPLLVVYNDEVVSYSCFCELMKRMVANFPHGGAMDAHFANMRSLIQILDNELFELMHQNGDYTHFYFCYRWFLLDFKRELVYDDVFRAWEAIWAAKSVASANFVLFIALALVEYYRDIILENNMDFTDIIKFFNEMAERHDATAVLKVARDLVLQIQTLIDNK